MQIAEHITLLPSNKGHSKLPSMKHKPAYPMVTMTMAMRMMRMEMFCCAEWKAR